MENTDSNVAATVADLVKTHFSPQQVELLHPTDGVTAPVIILPTHDGLTVTPVERFFDAYREHPARRQGTAVALDLPSFIAHANRFKQGNSAVFADNSKSQPSLTAVLDYHDAVNVDGVQDADALPRFGKHRCKYAFPLSPEWKAWNAKSGQPFEQAEFAAFIEERVLDILPAPVFGSDLSEADQALKRLADLLNGTFAGPEKMMQLSRGLAIYEASKVINATNINSGEGTITFEEEHQDSEGKKLTVPNLFLIGVPVFEAGAPYRVIVRLRYRKNGPKIVWFYELYRHDRVFEDAFKGACSTVTGETGLPLFVGRPEE